MVVEIQDKYESGEALNIVTPNTVMAIRGTVVAVRCFPTSDGGTRTVRMSALHPSTRPQRCPSEPEAWSPHQPRGS